MLLSRGLLLTVMYVPFTTAAHSSSYVLMRLSISASRSLQIPSSSSRITFWSFYVVDKVVSKRPYYDNMEQNTLIPPSIFSTHRAVR